ncbi:Hypothetical predicted protein [Lecanosticta acicola]|uniref:Uncharacterized protein n=1 Tax=Lecanosticta acicola TaxID=111012 RepID=A0AAI8YZ56_9PEZI|nr:Hypothetical predicted protein [Lecanosticta acicola]
MPRTVTETITKGLAIDPPAQTPFSQSTGGGGGRPQNMPGSAPYHHHHQQPGDAFSTGFLHVAFPAFTATLAFFLTAIAVFIGTLAVTYLTVRTWKNVLRMYTGRAQPASAEEEQATALAAAKTVLLSFCLTVLVLVLRARQALGSLSGTTFEVFALVLGLETGVAGIVGFVWVLVKGVEVGILKDGGAGGGGKKKAA